MPISYRTLARDMDALSARLGLAADDAADVRLAGLLRDAAAQVEAWADAVRATTADEGQLGQGLDLLRDRMLGAGGRGDMLGATAREGRRLPSNVTASPSRTEQAGWVDSERFVG